MKPFDMMPQWPPRRAKTALAMCRVLLSSHGFLTASEDKRVMARIEQWVKNNEDTKERT